MTIATTSPQAGLQFILNFTEHHGDRTHNWPTTISDDPTYLADKGVTWHFTSNETEETVHMWTVQGDNILADLTVNINAQPFRVAYETLRDATLDVLNAGECD